MLLPATSLAAIGEQLDRFTPSPSGTGRAIEGYGYGSTGYYTLTGSGDAIYGVDLATHQSLGTLTTNLSAFTPGAEWGALSWDPTTRFMWGSEYTAANGIVDQISTATGTVSQQFDAVNRRPDNVTVNGLALDDNGYVWLSRNGKGAASTYIGHYYESGSDIGDGFTVNFPNTGIANDGDYLWLADFNRKIYRYNKDGSYAGITIDTGPDISPEDLAIDTCSFPGKKALWTIAGKEGEEGLVAYDIGDSVNNRCYSDDENLKLRSRSVIAGRKVSLDARTSADPSGRSFSYIWYFGDSGRRSYTGYGRVSHKYRMGGYYRVIVTVVGGSWYSSYSRMLAVAFPSRVNKRVGDLLIGPQVTIRGGKVTAHIVTKRVKRKGKKKKGKRTKIKKVVFKVDGKRSTGKRKSKPVAIKRGMVHKLHAKVHIKKRKQPVTIKASFFA